LKWQLFVILLSMQNTAQFLLQDWFNLTGRGLVITGQIIRGQIASGDFVCLNDEPIKIKSVEIGDKRPNDFFIGLILEIKDQSDVFPSLNKLKGKSLLVLTATTVN
jgi:GTPase